jgi:transglutaminase-like putative cysteine protease
MTAMLVERFSGGCSLTQRIRYEYSKPVTDLRQRLIVVPPPLHGRQERVDWSLDVLGAGGFDVRSRRDIFGNERIDVVVPRAESWIEFDVRTTVAFSEDEGAAQVKRVQRFLRASKLTAADDAVAALLADGAEPAAICARVHEALTYEWGVTAIRTTAAEALAVGRGVCQDYAHVMVAACRLAGMPARYVSGHLLGEGGSHAWVEVLRPCGVQRGTWSAEAWDPTHCRRTDDTYITIATGRDYADVAPMSGTFSGDAEGRLTVRKQAIAHGSAEPSPLPGP